MMEFNQETSGLYVPIPEPEQNPTLAQEPNHPLKCQGCGKPVPINEPYFTLGCNGWAVDHWTCKHPKTYWCSDCKKTSTAMECPLCGCGEVYT